MKKDLVYKLLEMLLSEEPIVSRETMDNRGVSRETMDNRGVSRETIGNEDVSRETMGNIPLDDPLVGKPVIVRSRDSGVHFGYLEYNEGRTVQLKNSRRMWRWWAAKQMTLSAVAEFGLNHDKDLRLQNVLDRIRILDACEIIPCSFVAVQSIESVETYDEQY